jgi:hypothetical protein
MSRTLEVPLDETELAAVTELAAGVGTTPERLVAAWVRSRLPRRPAPPGRLEQLFGSADVGHPTGIDNDAIDADLARVYGRGGGG